jgi:glycyl-tRNA synthetase
MTKPTDTMEKIVALCRRRGFIFGSSEIYGGIGDFWDYGPLGCELKKNIKDAWWHDMVRNPPPGPGGTEYQMVGLDCSIIMNPKVWEASGHVGGFADPMRKCPGCGHFVRADQLWETLATASPWLDSLLQVFTPGTGQYDSPRLMKWAKTKGKKLAPNLALVRNPEVTLVWLATRVEGQPAAPPTMQEFTQYIATEQLHQTGLQEPCPRCGAPLGPPAPFKLMFETHTGVEQNEKSNVYLRPETAQGIFVNFRNVLDSTRVKIPFGIAQIGKAFRNEITPRNYTFRSREFEQMEIEFFCHPESSMEWYEFWRDVRIKWYESLNIKSEKLRPRQQGKEELAHYSAACTDIEYLFPFSDEPQELEGVAHRGDFDLKAHGKSARGDENAFAVIDDDPSRRLQPARTPGEPGPSARFVPHVIEPSAGVDRFALAAITEAYTFDEGRASPEFMKFHPRLAPIKAAVFPLVAKDGLPEIAEPIYREIAKHFPCQYDAKQSIGKRYARMDEAGTPFCFTIDGRTKEDGTVTVRDRDDASQERISADPNVILRFLNDKLGLH